MGFVFRQSIKSFLSMGGGAVLGALLTLAAPRILSPTQLGFSRNIVNQAAILQFFALLGIHNTLGTFLPRYPVGDPRRRALLGYSFAGMLAACLLLSAGLFLLQPAIVGRYQPADQALLRPYFWLLPAITCCWSVLSMFEAFLVTEKKIALMVFNKEIIQRCVNLLLLGAFAVQLVSFHGFAVGHLALYLVPVGFAAWVSLRSGRFRPSLTAPVDGATRGEWVRFSWYHMLTGLVLNLTGFIDSLLLPALDKNGLDALALYSIAVYVASLLYIPYKAMMASAYPVLNEAWAAGDTDKVRNLFSRAGLNILIASTLVLLLVVANLPLLGWLLPARYAGVGALALVLLVGRFSDVASGMNGELLSLSSRYKFAFRLSGALVVLLVALNVLLIPRFGAFGAAWSSSVALVLFNAVKMAYLNKHYGIPPASRATAKVLLAGAAAAVVLLVPAFGHPVVDSIVRSALLCGVYAAALYRLRPSPDLDAYLQSVRKSRRLF